MELNCKYCNIPMKLGIAIKPNENYRVYQIDESIDFYNLEIIQVLKCEKCGYSDDGNNDLKEK